MSGEIKFDDNNEPILRENLPEYQRGGLSGRAPADKEFQNLVKATDIIAKHRLQVTYGPDRTPNGPNTSVITFWLKGSRFSGGGDERMYWCMEADGGTHMAMDFVFDRSKKGTAGCGKMIPPSAISGGVAYCPHCGNMIKAEALTGEVYHRLATKDLGEFLAGLWHKMGGDADLYIKYHTSDIRFREMVVREGSQKANQLRGLLVYPLRNILTDTAHDVTVAEAFRRCLAA